MLWARSSVVEHCSDKAGVAGSNPAAPSGPVAQLGLERPLCTGKVGGSNPPRSRE